MEKFWLEDIIPKIEVSSVFKTSLAFGLLKLIIVKWRDQDKIFQIFPKSLAEVTLQLLARSDTASPEELMVTSALESLVEACKDNPKSQSELMKTLLDVNISFDKITGTNLVQKLLGNADFATVKMASEMFMEALANEGSTFNMQQRVFAGHQLAKLVGHQAANNEYGWKSELICFILSLTQFEVEKKFIWPLKALPMPLSKEAKNELKDLFFKSLDMKVKKLDEACEILCKVVEQAENLLKNFKPLQPLLVNGSNDISKAWKEMVKTVNKIKSQNNSKKEDNVFLMLLVHVGFQLFSAEPQGAVELLADLHLCYQKAKSGTARKSTRKSKKDEENEPLWIEVVTDLMLSLLSQNRNVLRQVVNSVTAMLCPFMTQKALQTILDVVNPPQDDEEAMEEDEEDSDDEFEPITEEEMAEIKAKNGQAESESEDEDEEAADSDEEESGDDESDNENKEPSDELKKRLEAALKDDSGEESDSNSINIDDLNDDAIAKLDSALGQVFKQLSGMKSPAEKKKEKKDAIAQVHFKIRALDMIDTYLSHQPALSNVLFLSIPLIKALENSSKNPLEAPLETRLKGTLKKLTNLKKLENAEDKVKLEDLTEILQQLIELGNSGSPVMAQMNQPIPLFAQLANLVLKISAGVADKKGKIQEIYVTSLDDFYQNTQNILPLTFYQIPCQGNWSGATAIMPKLVEAVFSNDVRLFRRIQSVTLLNTLYHNGNLREQIDAKLSQQLFDKLSQLLSDFVDGKANLKHKMLGEILHLIFGLHLTDVKKAQEWSKMANILEKVRDKVPKNRNFHDIKKAFNKISVPLNIKVVQGNEKRQKKMEANGNASLMEDIEANNPETNSKQSKKKKKKKVSKEVLQKRKERKRYELEDQYKNVQVPTFANALQDNINVDEAEAAAVPPMKKKKKTK